MSVSVVRAPSNLIVRRRRRSRLINRKAGSQIQLILHFTNCSQIMTIKGSNCQHYKSILLTFWHTSTVLSQGPCIWPKDISALSRAFCDFVSPMGKSNQPAMPAGTFVFISFSQCWWPRQKVSQNYVGRISELWKERKLFETWVMAWPLKAGTYRHKSSLFSLLLLL